jgi:hypothetical protein
VRCPFRLRRLTDPNNPPLRPVANSIAAMRRRFIAALVKTLPRCPCCAAQSPGDAIDQKFVTQ